MKRQNEEDYTCLSSKHCIRCLYRGAVHTELEQLVNSMDNYAKLLCQPDNEEFDPSFDSHLTYLKDFTDDIQNISEMPGCPSYIKEDLINITLLMDGNEASMEAICSEFKYISLDLTIKLLQAQASVLFKFIDSYLKFYLQQLIEYSCKCKKKAKLI